MNVNGVWKIKGAFTPTDFQWDKNRGTQLKLIVGHLRV